MTKYLPGIVLSFVLAFIANQLAEFNLFKQIGISGVIISIILGMIIGNTFYPKIASSCHYGVDFAKSKILRLAIILFGIKISFDDIALVGGRGIIIDILMVALTFLITIYIGIRFLKMDRDSAILIGSGCSICGTAAVVATEPTLKTKPEKVTIAVAVVVIFGTLAMFIYPVIYALIADKFNISESTFGIYIGSTVHEVAQVVAAGDAIGAHVTESAVITKMIRVILLAPFLLCLSIYLARSSDSVKKQIVIPWFAFGFLAMACISSLNILPTQLVQYIIVADNILLMMAMTALGLTSHYSVFKKAGLKPLILGLIIFIWLIVGGGAINYLVNIIV